MNGLHGISNAAGPLWFNLQITQFYPKEPPYLDYTAFFIALSNQFRNLKPQNF